MIHLKPSQKKLLNTKVHFTKSLPRNSIRGYELIRNPKDNNFYYIKDNQKKYYGRAAKNPKTWKINFNKSLYSEKKQKSGFVASINCFYLCEMEYPEKYFFC